MKQLALDLTSGLVMAGFVATATIWMAVLGGL